MKKVLNRFNAMLTLPLLTLLIALNSTTLHAQRRTYDVDKNPATINLPTNQANPTKFGDIVGINETGYVFWEWVYRSTDGSVVNPTVANSFKQTFPKIRLFHLMEYDYFKNNPSNQAIFPCANSNFDPNRLGLCATRDFYRVLRNDYPFIVSSVETTEGKGFPNKWYTESEWGSSLFDRKENAYKYAKAYLQTMDPDKNPNTALVDRFHTSNEHWGEDLGIESYKAICDGFIEGFTEYYQGNRSATPNQNQWAIKMWFGAYQAHKTAHVWDNDYVDAMMSNKAKQTLAGLDVHPYSFATENGIDDDNISQHPESDISYFQSIKSMVKWRNDNAPSMGLTATEFGWNDQNVPKRMNLGDVDDKPGDDWVIQSVNGNPSTQPNNPANWRTEFVGVGEEAQALYSIRAFLLLARYGFDSGYLYGSLDNNESLYQNTGVYKTQPLIETVPSGAFKYSNYPNASSDFIGEKKIMPAIRKFRNQGVIGNKHYLRAIKEDDNGVHAILVGDSPNGNPTHLVAWYAANINNRNESQILVTTISRTPAQIGLPSNLAINTNQNFTRLDWNESSVNNISPSSVYTNGTVRLSPIPIVIPLTSVSNPCVNQGGDNDNDGVCADVDCDDNDASIPTTPGTPCDDNDPNTSNSIIQADGCTCGVDVISSCDVVVNGGSGSVTISGISSSNLRLQIIGPGTGWSDQTICDGNCGSSQTVPNLTEGNYVVKVLGSNPGCYKQYDAIVGGNSCNNQGGDNDNDGVCADVDCDDNNPSEGAPQTPGTTCDDGNSNTMNDVIQQDGCTCLGETTVGGCQVNVSSSGNNVIISGASSGMRLQIIGYGTGWADVTICDGNCGSIETVPSLSAGNYVVKATNSNPGCYQQYDVTVGGNTCGNQGGDNDNDGVCADVDCDDNNPSKGVPQTPGTTCDDGNPNTMNDVINQDGCTCEGVPDGDACQIVQITPANGSVTISNITSSDMYLRIIGPGTGWSDLDICNGNCNGSQTVSNLSSGNYTVKILGNNPSCYEEYYIGISGNKIEQLNENQRLLVLPNPIQNQRPILAIHALDDDALTVQIYNTNSQLIHAQTMSVVDGLNEITLDFQDTRLVSGVYFVKVISPQYDYGATRFVKP